VAMAHRAAGGRIDGQRASNTVVRRARRMGGRRAPPAGPRAWWREPGSGAARSSGAPALEWEGVRTISRREMAATKPRGRFLRALRGGGGGAGIKLHWYGYGATLASRAENRGAGGSVEAASARGIGWRDNISVGGSGSSAGAGRISARTALPLLRSKRSRGARKNRAHQISGEHQTRARRTRKTR